MNDADRFKLLHGPYQSPRCRIGGKLFCEVRGWVMVRAMSDGRIVWPMTMRTGTGKAKGGGRPFLIVCGDLALAVKQESAIAICHWWGVTPQTVTVWRKALDVPQYNEGTSRLQRDWTSERLPADVQEKARAKANSPEANAKKAAWRKGRTVSAKTLAELAKGRRRCNTAVARQKRSDTFREKGLRPPVGELWTAEEEALLGVLTDEEVARRTGRSVAAVKERRRSLGKMERHHWTPAEDKLLGRMSDQEVTRRTGYPVAAVKRRRLRLGIKVDGRLWTEEELKLLGTMPDGELAHRLGRTAVAVARKRRSLGISPLS